MKTTYLMEKTILHHVVEMDESMIQRCIICGEVISDYTNAMWPSNSSPPAGFPEGAVYVTNGNPTISSRELMPGQAFEKCTEQ